jgi:hypothetical protein
MKINSLMQDIYLDDITLWVLGVFNHRPPSLNPLDPIYIMKYVVRTPEIKANFRNSVFLIDIKS